MHISRRAALAGFVAGLAPVSALATSELERLVEEWGGTVDRATEAYGRLARGMREVTATMLRHSVYRPRLEEALRQLTQLRNARRTLVQELREFVQAARNGQDARYAWESAMEQARRVSRIIATSSDAVGEMPELSSALSPQEREALRQSFTAREQLLARVQNLDPPSTEAELRLVEQLATRYQAWSDAANELRQELDRALNGA